MNHCIGCCDTARQARDRVEHCYQDCVDLDSQRLVEVIEARNDRAELELLVQLFRFLLDQGLMITTAASVVVVAGGGGFGWVWQFVELVNLCQQIQARNQLVEIGSVQLSWDHRVNVGEDSNQVVEIEFVK